MELLSLKSLVGTLVYSLMGVLIFCIGFIIVDKLTPSVNLWRELTTEKNLAVAVVAGCVALGIAIIVAAAIHG